MKVLVKLQPLFWVVMWWDIFAQSRISHWVWWSVFPLLGGVWIYECKHRVKLAGTLMLVFGAALNCIAILSNAGMMPVDRPERVGRPHGDKSHSVMSSSTRCRYLGDIIYAGPLVMSVGDIVICSGLPLLLVGMGLQACQQARSKIACN